MDGVERRAFERVPTDGVDGTISFLATARILDVSRGGLALETGARLMLNRELTMRLQSGSAGERLLRGTVVRCRLIRTTPTDEGELEPVYEAGVRFSEPLSGADEEWLAELALPQETVLDRPVSGRFAVPSDARMDLHASIEFKVEKASPGGLQICADYAPASESELALEIDLGRERLLATGRVAFVRPLGGEGRQNAYRIGIQLIELPGEGHEVLRRFLDEATNSP